MTTRWAVLTFTLLASPFVFMVWDPSSNLNSVEWSTFLVAGWAVLVLVGILATLLLNSSDRARLRELARIYRARRLDVCRRCGYDLAGSAEVGLCPECGLEYRRIWALTGRHEPPGESPAQGEAKLPPE